MTISIDTRGDRMLLILTLGALTALGPMSIDLYLPALPTIARDMGEPLSQIQYTLSAYTIGFALGQLIYGPLSDRFGRRKIMLPGLIAFIITSFLAAFTETSLQLIVIRILQAIASAAVMVTIPAMIRDLFPSQQVAKVLSSILLVMTVAPLIAPMLGGQMLKYWEWPSLFIFLGIFGCGSLVLALLRVRETLKPENRLQIPMSKLAKTYGSVISNREAMGCMLCHAFFFGGMFAFVAGSPFVYIELFGIPVEEYGLLFAANILALGAANMMNIRLIGQLELFSILRAGSLLACTASLILLFNVWQGIGGLLGVMLPVIVYVACIGFTGPNSNALALAHFPKSAGTANALGGTLRFGIGGITTALVGYFHDGTAWPMAVIMAGCGILSVGALMLTKRRGLPEEELSADARNKKTTA